MPLRILTVPCRTDNYAFVLHDDVTRRTALIDAPEVEPVMEVLSGHGWHLSDLLITHHHGDHVEGVEEFHRIYGCRVIGARADQHRLPPLDIAVDISDVEAVCGEEVHVIDVPGHTVGHIAYYMPGAQALFSGDSLMAMGCGRLFEGTPAQMWDSLKRLRALPPETMVYSGHEYTAANMRFALSLEPDNPALISRAQEIGDARAAGQPTVPSTLSLEIATNPFLRSDDPDLAAALDMSGAAPVDVFAKVRSLKDNF
ncbi:hydroxyacylglutathione hydrolase [Flavimaricola marinus]|uniref:Hydroxyacylglutathione hydrolase n=1 Tax=Flavimaricola marinus TaxID=1819565 RepID=A0A238L8Q9_9RHOB|nr:hydroxyacylglutathione hydrolase [Flavimaricola marinus]SMY05963.1 Hydroxyacylglutathione hydrolase [Flavimaricola marinus]